MKEDIIRMAREAGMPPVEIVTDKPVVYPVPEALERFATLVAAAEREACAKVCEDMAKSYEERSARPEKDRDINPEVARIAVMTCGFFKAAIRARGQDPMPLFDDWPGGWKK
jgi:hypothetical protein